MNMYFFGFNFHFFDSLLLAYYDPSKLVFPIFDANPAPIQYLLQLRKFFDKTIKQ